ncbi:MAG: hypothetical protein JSW43_07940 [Gemmatimonadota bacterium]|nr:MAG: hypothetical protein JSW43_07940 [Gemmatimonadota bacterium]
MTRLNPTCRFACMLLLAIAVTATPAAAQSPAIDPSLAARYFREAEQLSAADGGHLWGIVLYGPMLFADRGTRELAANTADDAGALEARAGVYVGTVPSDQNLANTAIEWAGQRWTMVLWPPPANRYDRQRLMMHELFHRVQPALGLAGSDRGNAHLETKEGRVWIRLEWRALEEALLRGGVERKQAVADAVAFRAKRHALFPEAGAEESALEQNEGLAEYTGLTLSGLPANVLADRAAVGLADREGSERLARSFAYGSGPAYGVLLDEAGVEWRERAVRGADLGALLAEAYGVPPAASEVEQRAGAYDGERLIAAETRRAERIAAELARLKEVFLGGPTLRLVPEGSFRYAFDPNGATPLAGVGTVYQTSRVSADWGVLTVESGGVLLELAEPGITGVVVPAPADAVDPPLEGEGWRLELAEGWRVVPAETPGSWVVVKEE